MIITQLRECSTPFHFAALNGHSSILRLLFDQINCLLLKNVHGYRSRMMFKHFLNQILHFLILEDSIKKNQQMFFLGFLKLSPCIQFSLGMSIGTPRSKFAYSKVVGIGTHFCFVHICNKYFNESLN